MPPSFLRGDVLLPYAAMSLVLFAFRKAGDRVILLAAIFFTLQPIEWYHYLMGLIGLSHRLPDYGVGAMYAAVGEVAKNGSFWDFIWCNVTLGQKASFMWAVEAGRTLQTAGTAFDMWQKLAFTFVQISSFVLLYQNDAFKERVPNLRFTVR